MCGCGAAVVVVTAVAVVPAVRVIECVCEYGHSVYTQVYPVGVGGSPLPLERGSTRDLDGWPRGDNKPPAPPCIWQGLSLTTI